MHQLVLILCSPPLAPAIERLASSLVTELAKSVTPRNLGYVAGLVLWEVIEDALITIVTAGAGAVGIAIKFPKLLNKLRKIPGVAVSGGGGKFIKAVVDVFERADGIRSLDDFVKRLNQAVDAGLDAAKRTDKAVDAGTDAARRASKSDVPGPSTPTVRSRDTLEAGARKVVGADGATYFETKTGKVFRCASPCTELTPAEERLWKTLQVDAGRKASGGAGSGAPRGGRETALSGRIPEEAVSDATGIPLNRGAGRQTVPGTGPGRFRIPDLQVFGPNASLALRGSIIEVKNVARLSGTRQIRDLAAQARSLGGRLEIFTNAPAPSRGRLADLIEEGVVVLRPIP